jgi:uncharacterized membrane protein YgdD (TMEM256/DUF423 family)
MREAEADPIRLWLVAGAANAFMAVAMGALAAHGLKDHLPADALDWVRTGATYQMWHGLALILVAILASTRPGPALRIAGIGFFAGCVMFSGSLYLLALTDWRGFAFITPLGGLAFLIGWAAIVWQGIRKARI